MAPMERASVAMDGDSFLLPATTLVLFPAATRAGFVPTHLVLIPRNRFIRRILITDPVKRLLPLASLGVHPFHILFARHLDMKNLLQHLIPYPAHHLHKQAVGFPFVFLLGIFLAVTAQTDTLLEVIDRQQVILPL